MAMSLVCSFFGPICMVPINSALDSGEGHNNFMSVCYELQGLCIRGCAAAMRPFAKLLWKLVILLFLLITCCCFYFFVLVNANITAMQPHCMRLNISTDSHVPPHSCLNSPKHAEFLRKTAILSDHNISTECNAQRTL